MDTLPTEEIQVKKKPTKRRSTKKNNSKTFIGTLIAFITVLVLTVIVMILVLVGTNNTIKEMHKTYINNTDEIITMKAEQDVSNSWERKPENEKRELLKARYTEIVTYYTVNIEDKYKMSTEQIMSTFNQLYACLGSVPKINFFLPVAYIKVATNFNPVHNRDWKFGLSAFYQKTGQAICNLPRIKADKNFFTVWNGLQTLNRPEEAIKLLVARIDDLMLTFNNREDWVLLSLFTNEYDIISKYWDGGEGKIPDDFFRDGFLAEVLKYYYSFKNWQIPERE
jgi:hypothetical protein